MSEKLTRKILKSSLFYDQESGIFTWIKRCSKCIRIGDIAGTLAFNGYIKITINGKIYASHRLAFLYMKGYFPEFVDHINHNRIDNRWINLRKATYHDNNTNRSPNKNNTSGFNGVYRDKNKNKWRSQISISGKLVSLGSFINIEDAIEARKEANIKYGFHENHGVG